MPRTDTSDNLGSRHAGVFRLCNTVVVNTGQSLYQSNAPGVTVVVTTMDLVNIGSQGSVSSGVGLLTVNSGQVYGLFGAITGTGALDTFSWRGELALYQDDQLVSLATTGTWTVVASGYKIPTLWSG